MLKVPQKVDAVPKRPTKPKASFADKLDHLFRTVHPAGRREYTYEEVATGVAEHSPSGTTISAQYVWMLRTGKKDNPTKRHIEALAAFFGVPPAYFFDDELSERVDAELEMLSALRDSSVRSLALRSAELSPAAREAIARMIDAARDLEGERGS